MAGYISSAFDRNTCEWPFGVYVCGSSFCSLESKAGSVRSRLSNCDRKCAYEDMPSRAVHPREWLVCAEQGYGQCILRTLTKLFACLSVCVLQRRSTVAFTKLIRPPARPGVALAHQLLLHRVIGLGWSPLIRMPKRPTSSYGMTSGRGGLPAGQTPCCARNRTLSSGGFRLSVVHIHIYTYTCVGTFTTLSIH